eukprot:1217071-Pyramimonas_sp.AAC.1
MCIRDRGSTGNWAYLVGRQQKNPCQTNPCARVTQDAARSDHKDKTKAPSETTDTRKQAFLKLVPGGPIR